MTAISKPDTYSIPGQPEVDLVADQVVEYATDRRVTLPMSELEMLTLAATDAAESIHTVPDFGEPTDDHRNERRIVDGGAVSAVEFAPVAVHEAVDETSFVVLTGYGRALRVFREDR